MATLNKSMNEHRKSESIVDGGTSFVSFASNLIETNMQRKKK